MPSTKWANLADRLSEKMPPYQVLDRMLVWRRSPGEGPIGCHLTDSQWDDFHRYRDRFTDKFDSPRTIKYASVQASVRDGSGSRVYSFTLLSSEAGWYNRIWDPKQEDSLVDERVRRLWNKVRAHVRMIRIALWWEERSARPEASGGVRLREEWGAMQSGVKRLRGQ